jgi:hypothetical protein
LLASNEAGGKSGFLHQRAERLVSHDYVSVEEFVMAKKKRQSIKKEHLAENKELGLEKEQEMFDVLFAVLREHNIDEELWLAEYIRACPNIDSIMAGEHAATPPADFERFLPWNMPDDMRSRLQKRTLLHL